MDSQQVILVPQPHQQQLPMTSTSTLQHSSTTAASMVPQQQPQHQPQCAICGTTVKLLRCAKCKCIYYCSTDHQHRDWPTHKQECRQLAKQRQINNRLQQLTININSNSPVATMNASSIAATSSSNTSAYSNSSQSYYNWQTNYPTANVQQYSHNPDGSLILGTNENEIMCKAESVTQNSLCGEYSMGNFVNSTTCDQMHAMQGLSSSNTSVDNNQFVDLTSYYQQSTDPQLQQQQQQLPQQNPLYLSGSTEHMQQQQQQQQQMYVPPHPQQQHPQQPVPQFSNYLINQHEKSSSYQIGAAVVGDNTLENAK